MLLTTIEGKSDDDPLANCYQFLFYPSCGQWKNPLTGKDRKTENSWSKRQEAEFSRLFGTHDIPRTYKECAKRTGSGFMGLYCSSWFSVRNLVENGSLNLSNLLTVTGGHKSIMTNLKDDFRYC